MDEMGAVLDAEVDLGVDEVEAGSEQVDEGAEQIEQTEGAEAGKESDSPYTTKFSREMRAALKAWEQANPQSAKYAKQARDNHARLFALSQLEPKGIDGVRERYALLDSLSRGELKGSEALTAMQQELAGVAEVDSLLAAGDPRAFEALGEDFNQGLAKLAPAYLERVQKSDPAAYDAAVLPHFVGMLASSDLVKEYNALVDVLNAQNDPRFDDKTKMQFAMTQLGKMGQWLNTQQQKAGEIKPASGPQPADDLAQQRSALEQDRQNLHWDTKIAPQASSHENTTFNSLFDPYQKRLKLDPAAKADLMEAFKAGLNKAGSADQDYMRQMKNYRAQKNPDPAIVANYVKNAINKHSKPVMEALVKARYGAFLNGTPKAKPAGAAIGKPLPAAGPNVQVVTVKPAMNEIDHRATPIDWLAKKQYRLFSGKVVQVRPQ